MASSFLHGVVPTTAAFSLLGWLPRGSKSSTAPLEVADYSNKCSAKGPVPESRLKDVQVLFRHGARTPLARDDTYWKGTSWNICGERYEGLLKSLRKGSDRKLPVPALNIVGRDSHEPEEQCIDEDVSKDLYPGGCSKGELTKLGQEQAVELGVWLRRRYTGTGAPVDTGYSSENVLAHSTNYRRTRATMHGVLLGLYPEARESFRVETSDFAGDLLLGQMKSCHKFSAWFKSNRARLEEKDTIDEEALAAGMRMRTVLGIPLDDNQKRVHFGELNDCLTCMRAHGKPINPGFTAADLDLINRLATDRIVRLFTDPQDPEVASLLMGRLLSVMHERLHAAAESSADSQGTISLWCGHDTTLMPVMKMLGQAIPRWPPYASSLVIELWEDTTPAAQALTVAQRHYVRVLFNGCEIAVPPATATAGDAMTLERFEDAILSRCALSEDERAARCAVMTSWWDILSELGLGNASPGQGKVDSSKY